MMQLGLLAVETGPSFGERILAARLKQGLSLRQLADIAGIDHATLLRVETGEQAPSPETEARLQRALKGDHDDGRLMERVVRWWVNNKEWRADFIARRVLRDHPGGLQIEQIAELMQIDSSTVDADLASALGKLRVLANRPGRKGAETRRWVELIQARAEAREERESRVVGKKRG